MSKLNYIFIGIIVILVGVIIFTNVDFDFTPPPLTSYKYIDSEEDVFIDTLEEYDLSLMGIYDMTTDFYGLTSVEITTKSQVFDQIKIQLNLQYLETPNEHYEIYVYYSEVEERFYYFCPPRLDHEGYVTGYIDNNTKEFHIGHQK